MAESEEESEILVRACNGDLWLVKEGAIPKKVYSEEDPELKDQGLKDILYETDNKLAAHFESANPGVKLGITVVDL